MPMSVKDRDALLKVVKGRFELLENEVTRRAQMLRRQIDEDVTKEYATKVTSYRVSLGKLEKEMQALIQKGRDLAIAAEKDGVKIATHTSNASPASGQVSMVVTVENREKIIQDRFNAIKAKGKLNGGLRDLELKIVEELITATLESDEAKGFMSQIPSLDDVLPAPTEMLKITK